MTNSYYYNGIASAARTHLTTSVANGGFGWYISDKGGVNPVSFNDTTDGNWNSGSTWGNAGSVEGTDYPGLFNPVTIDSNTVTLSANQSSGDTTISGAGTLDLAGNQLSVAGNWNNTGAFNANSGTISLNGYNQSISGDSTFYNLIKSTTATDTLTFAASSTQSIAPSGTLTLSGIAGHLLLLRSSLSPNVWNLNLDSSANKTKTGACVE